MRAHGRSTSIRQRHNLRIYSYLFYRKALHSVDIEFRGNKGFSYNKFITVFYSSWLDLLYVTVRSICHSAGETE